MIVLTTVYTSLSVLIKAWNFFFFYSTNKCYLESKEYHMDHITFDLWYKYLIMEMTWYMFLEGQDRLMSNPRVRLDEAGEKYLARWMPASWMKQKIQAFCICLSKARMIFA